MNNPTLILVLFTLLLHRSASQLNLSYEKVLGRARIELPLVLNGKALYNAKLHVGGVVYYLVLDTGSSLPWIQCIGPHVKPAYNPPYEPHNNRVAKRDPECPNYSSSAPPNDLCDFHKHYMDGGSCFGIMIKDNVQLYDIDSSHHLNTQLVLGCGEYSRPTVNRERLYFDGVLGLGTTRPSFTSQLVSRGLTINFFGHCLSSYLHEEHSGYVFFGNSGATSDDVVWLPFKQARKYVIGPAILSVEGARQGLRLHSIELDSGSSYTSFSSRTYTYIKDMIQLNLNQSRAPLQFVHRPGSVRPFCWKLDHQIHMSRYFNPIKLDFLDNRVIVLEAESYLKKSGTRKICLSILDNNSTGINILGASSMKDRLVIYDNERNRLGWSIIPTRCIYHHRAATNLETGVLESIPTNASSIAVHRTTHG